MSAKKVLVYHHRAGDHPVVKKGLAVVSEKELEDILKRESHLQMTSKTIPRSSKVITVYEHDLYTSTASYEPENNPNRNANVAAVDLPGRIWLENLVTGKFTKLVILSAKR